MFAFVLDERVWDHLMNRPVDNCGKRFRHHGIHYQVLINSVTRMERWLKTKRIVLFCVLYFILSG